MSTVDEKLYDCEKSLSYVEKYDNELQELKQRISAARIELKDVLDVLGENGFYKKIVDKKTYT